MSRITKIVLILTVLIFTVIEGCVIGDDEIVNPVDSRSKYLGNWKVNEDCSRMNYTVYISADPGNSTQVLIENFGNPGPGYDPAVGLVVSNTIKVSNQNIGEGWIVSGQGTYKTDGSITWSYSLVINGLTETCSAIYTR